MGMFPEIFVPTWVASSKSLRSTNGTLATKEQHRIDDNTY